MKKKPETRKIVNKKDIGSLNSSKSEAESKIENEKDVAEYILKRLTKQADDAIVTTSNSNSTQIKFVNNKISNITNWDITKIDVFVADKKRIATTAIKECTKESADEIIQKLMKFVRSVKPSNEYKGIAKGPFKYVDIEETYDKNFFNIGEKGIDFVEQGINTAAAGGAKRVSGVLETGMSFVNLKTTGNIDVDEKGTSLYYSIRSLVDKDASGHWTACSRMLNKFSPDWAARESAEIAKMSKNPQPGPMGKFDILFAPLPFCNVVEHVGNAASIFSVESGLSCLHGKLGKRVGNEKVMLVDDGRMKNGFGSTVFDSEGYPTQRTVIIDKGILKTYLHNSSSAKRYGVKSTGNAGLVSPDPHNLIFGGGKFSRDEMISEIKKGIYVTNVWYTRFQNYATGDFSTIPRDGCFYVENGKIKYPIKGIRISDNLLNILNKVDMIGNDNYQVHSWEVDTPVVSHHALVKGLNITKPSDS